jgi:hypothetical protein
MPTKRAVIRQPVPAEDDGDEDPAPRLKAAPNEGLRVKRGWGEAQKQMDSTSTYAQAFKPDERGCIIKFLEDDPYAGFKRHWIDQTLQDEGGRPVKTRRPYTCMKSFTGDNGKPKECPLCDVGDKPQAVSCFNIVICAEDGSLALKSWDMGAKVYNLAKTYADNVKIGPLTKNFYHVTKTGKQQQSQTNMSPVRATSLAEDYDVPVPTDAALNAIDMYTEDIIKITSMKDLRELAEEMVDDYE